MKLFKMLILNLGGSNDCMKRTFILAFALGLVFSLGSVKAYGQAHRDSHYYNSRTGRMDYSHNNNSSRNSSQNSSRLNPYSKDKYFGFRIGPSFSSISGDNQYLKGSSVRSGLNVGVVGGFALTDSAPLYLEFGLSYTEKGGKGYNNSASGSGDSRFTTRLGYLEVPLELKYVYNITSSFSIQPFFGGYLDVGICGKIKDFGQREAYDSFSDNKDAFKRCDAGLRFGCGAGYDLFYMELAYDLGLANIGHDYFDTAANRTFQINFGVNF